MCTGFEIAALAASAVASGTAYVNQQNTAKRQDNQLASQLRAQGQKQQQADAKTAALIQSQQQSSDKQDKAKSLAGFNQATAAKAAAANAPLNSMGAVSDAFTKDKANAALGITKFGNDYADNVSSIDAPTQQRQRDALTFGRYGTDVGEISRRNQGDNYLSNMHLRGIKPNPLLGLFSGLAGGAAGALARGGGDDLSPYIAAPNLVNDLPDVWGYNQPSKPYSYMAGS